MEGNKMIKLTVGDMSGSTRHGKTAIVVRQSIASIEVGEIVMMRFKDEFHVTPWRKYKLSSKYFRDEFDRARGRFTGVFTRLEG